MGGVARDARAREGLGAPGREAARSREWLADRVAVARSREWPTARSRPSRAESEPLRPRLGTLCRGGCSARRCCRFGGAHSLRPVRRHRCDVMRCCSQAQAEGPLQLKCSSQLKAASHIVFNIGPVSALWASSAMSSPHLQAEEGASLVRKTEKADRPDHAAKQLDGGGIPGGDGSTAKCRGRCRPTQGRRRRRHCFPAPPMPRDGGARRGCCGPGDRPRNWW